MRSRPVLRRLALRPRNPTIPSHLSTHRAFTAKTSTRTLSRPQLAFLDIPASRHQFRYLTTERRAWIFHQTRLAARWTIYFWSIVAAASGINWAIGQEWQERQHPTPHEWSFRARMWMRGALCELDRTDVRHTDYVKVVELLRKLIKRLEDPGADGKGLVALSKELEGLDDEFQGLDLSSMPENWRRGYHEALLALTKASEHVDGWVVDRTRKYVFPPDLVIGPSNPRPKPIPPGSPSAPREEDCDLAFPRTDEFYAKLGRMRGLSPSQEVEDALAAANWAEYKGDTEAAERQFAVAMRAAAKQVGTDLIASGGDIKKSLQRWATKDTATPSENLLDVRTALATFYARTGDIEAAIPMLVSLLKTRRSLPVSSVAVADGPVPGRITDKRDEPLSSKLLALAMSIFKEPDYPAPPPDGSRPPVRDAKELCKEAALQLHIGEVLYASSKGASAGREEGLAWTREAIDTAEEQLHRLGRPTAAQDATSVARSTCRQCLGAGLDNWAEMVSRLAREEEAKRKKVEKNGEEKPGWFGFWGEGRVEDTGRWGAEEKVVKQRTERAKDLLEQLPPPSKGIMSLFAA